MKAIFMVILSIVPMLCHGQIDINKAFEALKQARTETSIVESSVLPELSIVRQQYRLARDGKTYGKNNKPYYGETYSLGIKISNGMIISNSVVEPWSKDDDFKRLNNSNQYKPELFWTYQRSLSDVNYSVVDFEFGTEYTHPLSTCNQLYVHEEKKGDFGLAIDNTPGEKTGYMLWVYTDTNLQDSAMSVSIKHNPMRIVASEDSARIFVDVNDFDKILGGLYITPKYDRGGRIQLQIVGIAVPVDNEKKWELALLTKGIAEKNLASSNPTEVQENKGSSEPTPIESEQGKSDNKGKKKKK